MYKLKKLENILEPDPIWKSFAIFDHKLGQNRARTLKDHYSSILEISITEKAPNKICEHFEIAKNLLLYSWFDYRFIPVSENYSYISVEYALKEKTGLEKWGLKRLIKYAIDNGWIKDENFKNYHRIKENRTNYNSLFVEMGVNIQKRKKGQEKSYVEILLESIPNLRNFYAHGSSVLYPGGYLTLEICGDFINQLYI